ncbi:Zona pellucida sperm-binding protein 3 [Bagarius yarrelli]|uniref:Zona pellucida sperm-binding protein 3 n=1 Tax=Bagarius yarrelli TaxID=175774 RepID=A0A556VW06_BAGYA|nr:Zona pellucida sperm-binding protein 3 [Bagarius yarrelli]
MDGTRLLFFLLVCVFSFPRCVLAGAGRGDEQSTITALKQEQLYLHPQPAAITPPYLLLPMFQHLSAPAVAKELFSPAAGSRVLPSALSNILVPQGLEPYIRVTPVSNDHGVEVWCGYSKITVRIDQALLNFRSFADHFRLGTCPVSRAERGVLYFQYELSECASVLSVMNGKLLYANKVLYRPESQGAVLRAVPLTLPVQCVYDRFHYSYKIGFLPESGPRWFRKTMVRKQVFSLSVCNDQWQELGLNGSYVLGEPAYFEVSAEKLPKDKRVYVEACHVTQIEESNSIQRYDVISNFGETSLLQMAVVSSNPWSLSHNVSMETSEELNAMLGSVQLHHLHHPGQEESQESGDEQDESQEQESGDEQEESCAKELEEEVVMGVLEHEKDNDLMSDEGLEEGRKKNEENGADEGQKNVIDTAVKFWQKNFAGEELRN